MGNEVYKFHAGGFKLDSNNNVKVLFRLLKKHIAIIRTSSKKKKTVLTIEIRLLDYL